MAPSREFTSLSYEEIDALCPASEICQSQLSSQFRPGVKGTELSKLLSATLPPGVEGMALPGELTSLSYEEIDILRPASDICRSQLSSQFHPGVEGTELSKLFSATLPPGVEGMALPGELTSLSYEEIDVLRPASDICQSQLSSQFRPGVEGLEVSELAVVEPASCEVQDSVSESHFCELINAPIRELLNFPVPSIGVKMPPLSNFTSHSRQGGRDGIMHLTAGKALTIFASAWPLLFSAAMSIPLYFAHLIKPAGILFPLKPK